MKLLLTLVLLLVGLTVSGQERELQTLTQLEDGKRYLVLEGALSKAHWVKLDLENKKFTTQDGTGVKVHDISVTSNNGSGVIYHVVNVKFEVEHEGKKLTGSTLILVIHMADNLDRILLKYPQEGSSYMFLKAPANPVPNKEELKDLDADKVEEGVKKEGASINQDMSEELRKSLREAMEKMGKELEKELEQNTK